MKKCTKCDEVKDVCLFNKCARNKSGLRAECKVCQSIYEQARRNLFEAEGRPIKQLIGVKKCTNCNILKPYSSFYRRGDASGTYKSQCKDCLRPAITDTNAAEMKHLGAVIKWVIADIAKEETPTLVEAQVELKDLSRYVSSIVKTYYQDHLKAY